MNSLSASIDALYDAFRDVPKPPGIEGCPCCIDHPAICTLLSKPLRELTGRELASYSASAFLTVGGEADYLYFLPRILEIGCTEAGRWPDIEVTGRAIGETHPGKWPAKRKRALLEVLHAVVQQAIAQEAGWTIDQWICAIAKMGFEVLPFLEQIGTSSKALLAYYECNAQSLIKQKPGNSFWEPEDPGYQTVLSWFQSPGVSRIILDGYSLGPIPNHQGAAREA
jgi:hypothetical protein